MEHIITTILNVMGVLLLPVVSYAFWVKKEDFKLKQLNKELNRELEEYKIRNQVLDDVISISSANKITNAVNEIFHNTPADRFLLLFAINGKHHFNVISVFFEQHESPDLEINAISRYKDVKIDQPYRDMLNLIEEKGGVLLSTDEMEDCVLKEWYELEGINHAYVTHILRHEIDSDNDVVIYSSYSTHKKMKFTKRNMTYAKLKYDSAIIPNINKLLPE